MYRLFLGDTQGRLVAYDAHNVCLPPCFVYGVAHCLTINRKALVFCSKGCVPLLQGEIEPVRIDPDQHIPGDGLTGRWEQHIFYLRVGTRSVRGFLVSSLLPTPRWPCSHACRTGLSLHLPLGLANIGRRCRSI